MGETVGGRNLKEHPAPWKVGECSRGAAHNLSGLGKALGEGQRMTRLQGQLAQLWDVTLAPWQKQGHPNFKWETHIRESLPRRFPGPSFRMKRAKPFAQSAGESCSCSSGPVEGSISLEPAPTHGPVPSLTLASVSQGVGGMSGMSSWIVASKMCKRG